LWHSRPRLWLGVLQPKRLGHTSFRFPAPDPSRGQALRGDAISCSYGGSGGGRLWRWPRLYYRRLPTPVCYAKIENPAEIFTAAGNSDPSWLRTGNRELRTPYSTADQRRGTPTHDLRRKKRKKAKKGVAQPPSAEGAKTGVRPQAGLTTANCQRRTGDWLPAAGRSCPLTRDPGLLPRSCRLSTTDYRHRMRNRR
jgi:hypothetical protein